MTERQAQAELDRARGIAIACAAGTMMAAALLTAVATQGRAAGIQIQDDGVAQAIAGTYRAIASAEIDGRNDEIGRYYDDRAIIVIPRAAPMARDEAAEALQERAQPEDSYIAGETDSPIDLVVSGDTALDMEEIDLLVKQTRARNGNWSGIHKGMRSLTAWKRENDGRWRIFRQTFTANS